MIKFADCIRCGSKNVDSLMVNSFIRLNYPEKKNQYTGAISQKIVEATDALVCKDCGHIELFIDWSRGNDTTY